MHKALNFLSSHVQIQTSSFQGIVNTTLGVIFIYPVETDPSWCQDLAFVNETFLFFTDLVMHARRIERSKEKSWQVDSLKSVHSKAIYIDQITTRFRLTDLLEKVLWYVRPNVQGLLITIIFIDLEVELKVHWSQENQIG